uniref:Uncharacterized protein n=1 Tax=Arundo donax TaxID=35708 RepID=A0A0A9H481_ARUDO
MDAKQACGVALAEASEVLCSCV